MSALKLYYCPVCGFNGSPYGFEISGNKCHYCGTINPPVETQYDLEYYEKLQKKKYGYTHGYWDLVVEAEISKNPLFNREANKWMEIEHERVANNMFEKSYHASTFNSSNHSTPNVPTCPTCHSTNVKKISFTKGYLHWRAFGLLSKTARSQFECNNCGYKW